MECLYWAHWEQLHSAILIFWLIKTDLFPWSFLPALGGWDTVHRGNHLLYYSIQCCSSNLLIILTDLVRTTEQILGAYSWFIFGSQGNFELLFNKYLLAWYAPIKWSHIIDARKSTVLLLPLKYLFILEKLSVSSTNQCF